IPHLEDAQHREAEAQRLVDLLGGGDLTRRRRERARRRPEVGAGDLQHLLLSEGGQAEQAEGEQQGESLHGPNSMGTPRSPSCGTRCSGGGEKGAVLLMAARTALSNCGFSEGLTSEASI